MKALAHNKMELSTKNKLFVRKGYQRIMLQSTEGTEQICAELVEFVNQLNPQDFNENSGLYLVTPDAGISTSVTFWEEAMEKGPGLVGPRLFPYTLANSPASCLGRLLEIKGPSITLVGGKDQLSTLQQMAKDDQINGRIKNALIVFLNLEVGEALVMIQE